MKPCEIWIEQCEATRQIEAEFGTQNALDYLIGEKFLNFLQAAETDAEFRAEIPASWYVKPPRLVPAARLNREPEVFFSGWIACPTRKVQ